MNTIIFILALILAPIILFYLGLFFGILVFAIIKELKKHNGKI